MLDRVVIAPSAEFAARRARMGLTQPLQPKPTLVPTINEIKGSSEEEKLQAQHQKFERERRDQHFQTMRANLIQQAVSCHFGILRRYVIGQDRMADIILPRQIAMYLTRTITNLSYPHIGMLFGGRHHTTVMHATRKIGRMIEIDLALAETVDCIRRRVQPEEQSA